MISKEALTEWKKDANKDLKGVAYRQIAKEIDESEQVVKNYMTLTNQKRFDEEIIEKINGYRTKYKTKVQSLTTV